MRRGGRGGTSRYARGGKRGRDRDDYDDYEDDEPYFAPRKNNTPLIIGLCVVGGVLLLGGAFLILGSDTADVENVTYELFAAVNSNKGDYAVNSLANPDQVAELGPRQKAALIRNPSWLTRGLTGSPIIQSIDGVLEAGNQKAVTVSAKGGTKTIIFIKLGGGWFVHLPASLKNQLLRATSDDYFEVPRGRFDGPPTSSGGDDWLNEPSGTSRPRGDDMLSESERAMRNW